LDKINGKWSSRRMKNKGEILASILKNFKDCYFFLHNTREFNIVGDIMNEGFIFESQLAHSTDYGNYTIIIAIPKTIYDNYTIVSNKKDADIEEVLTVTDPYWGDNDELIYTLSPKHILGYFNIKTSEFYQNRNWDPFFSNCQVYPSGKKTGKSLRKK
jgi:hypothetical protein